jgi:hypothetical protein
LPWLCATRSDRRQTTDTRRRQARSSHRNKFCRIGT